MREHSIEQQLPPELLKEYEILKQSFLNRLKVVIPELRSSFTNFIENESSDNLKHFYNYIHKLSGSAGMYGFVDISENCNEIAVVLKPVLSDFLLTDRSTIELLATKYQVLDKTLKTYENV